MLIKATVLGCALVSTPLCFASLQDMDRASDQDRPQQGAAPAVRVSAKEEALRAQIRKLDAALQKLEALHLQAQREAGEAKAQLQDMRARLESCMDLLESSLRRVTHRNCTPSRSRRLLTYYQWMQQNDQPIRAAKMMDEVLKEHGRNNGSLNNLAWHLLTERETAGKFDQAALAVAERMEKNGRLQHNEYDTIALAKFLNGKVTEAVAFQRKALDGNRSSDYVRRLRVYEAALRNATPATDSALAGGQQ